MKTRFVLALSAAAFAAMANAAPFADMPAAGEGPFASEDTVPSTLSRAEVQAAAIATPPAFGNGPPVEANVVASGRTRDEVTTEAIANPPDAGNGHDALAMAQSLGPMSKDMHARAHSQ